MGSVDKVKDKAQAVKGDTKATVGRATGDRDMEAQGEYDKTAGNLKQAGEKVKDAFRR